MPLSPAGVILLLAGYCSGLAAPALSGPPEVSGPLGESVSVQCHYREGYRGYKKYWCRGAVWGSCYTAVESTGSDAEVKREKVSIRDNPRLHSFTVTMENLTLADAGIYWCGISKVGPDPGVGVKVTVLQGYFSAQAAGELTAPMEVSGSLGESVSVPCRYRARYWTRQKYWCRGSEWKSCSKVIETTPSEAEVKSGRVSIRDNYTESTFTVTLENLTQRDAGTYWCGINRPRAADANIRVRVAVLPVMTTTGSMATASGPVIPSAEPPHKMRAVNSEILLPVILLVLVILLIGAILLARRIMMKRKNVAGAVGTPPASNEAVASPEGNVTYAVMKPNPRKPIATAPSPPLAQAEHGPERVEYSTGAPGRTDVFYATLKYPILDEQAIYTNVDRTSNQTPRSSPQEQTTYCELKKK